MKLYMINHGFEDGPFYFATLSEARNESRELAQHYQESIEVQEVQLHGTLNKQIAIRLLTGRGWCLSSKVVFTAEPE